MGESFCVRKIIDSYEVDVGVTKPCPHHRAADASEAVDTYFNSHYVKILQKVRISKP
jgi:hypothetical protein